MNLPNKLTVLRILFIPVIMVFLLMEGIPFRWLIGGLCFGAASLTDFLDGKIARKRNLITDFGKLMDPVADKMLIMSTLICFVQENICGAWVVVVILFREFLITSMRMIAVDKGKVIAANIWGKIKTVTQMIAIIGIFWRVRLYSGFSRKMAFDNLICSALHRGRSHHILRCKIYVRRT